MSDPVETTLEEASRCPKCKNPGRYQGERELESVRGAKLKIFGCENERCKWYSTTWTVQVNRNGTVPPATLRRPKQFTALPDDGGKTLQSIEQQLRLEQSGGGEVSYRHR